MKYTDQLRHPKWQKRRLEVLQRAEFRCECCGDREKTLHIHHKFYKPKAMVWEYEDDEMLAVCALCHQIVQAATEYFLSKIPGFNFLDIGRIGYELGRISDRGIGIEWVAELLKKDSDEADEIELKDYKAFNE